MYTYNMKKDGKTVMKGFIENLDALKSLHNHGGWDEIIIKKPVVDVLDQKTLDALGKKDG